MFYTFHACNFPNYSSGKPGADNEAGAAGGEGRQPGRVRCGARGRVGGPRPVRRLLRAPPGRPEGSWAVNLLRGAGDVARALVVEGVAGAADARWALRGMLRGVGAGPVPATAPGGRDG